jgi:exopolysaccharide biosynthesis polyprenyl glycosylphosphotransferase
MNETSLDYDQPLTYGPSSSAAAPKRSGARRPHSSPVADVSIRTRTIQSRERTVDRDIYRYTDAGAAVIVGLWLTAQHAASAATEPLLERPIELRALIATGLLAGLWMTTLALFGDYDRRPGRRYHQDVNVIIAAAAVSALLGTMLSLVVPIAMSAGRLLAALSWLAASTLLARWTVRASKRALRPRATPSVLIVGSGPRALRTYHEMCHGPGPRCRLVGFIDDAAMTVHPEIRQRLLGGLDHLSQLLMRNAVDEVVIALPVKSCYTRIQRTIDVCEGMGVESRFPADIFRCDRTEPQLRSAERAIALRRPSDTRLLTKRGIDIVGAVIGLALTLPLLLAIGVMVRLNSRGPALFVQQRYGYRKRSFRMYKFRTMVANAELLQPELEARNEAIGPVFKIRQDPRVTKFGRWLRKTSLDELPQLWNVFVGDMSLVGPRPMTIRDVHGFTEPWLMRRFSVRPGMTGLWQVSGRSDLPFDSWVELDLAYIDDWSLTLDWSILLRTIPAVLRGTGAA